MRRLVWTLVFALGLAVVACDHGVKPQGGATFSGPIAISGVATAGTICFTVSGDGETVTPLSIEFSDLQIPGFSAQHTGITDHVSIPAGDGGFETRTTVGRVKCRFTTPTEATGTLDLQLQVFGPGTPPQELGQWSWTATATASQNAAWPWDDIPL